MMTAQGTDITEKALMVFDQMLAFLPETNEELSAQLFDPTVWSEPLEKFSRASGLTVSLYDAELHRRGPVTTSSPIGERFKKAELWSPEGLGTEIDRQAARHAIERRETCYSVQMGMFSHVAIPLIIDSVVTGVFVMGWIPERFADPVQCDVVAKKIGAASMEIWQLMRMQQPISRDKLQTHVHMLEIFSLPLVRQLIVQIEDRRRVKRTKVISEATLGFARSSTESQICEVAFRSFRNMGPVTAISVRILKNRNESEEVVQYNEIFDGSDLADSIAATRKSHSLPIPSNQGHSLGTIEITVAEPGLSEELLNDVHIITGQFGIALQKVHLIHALESERSALKAANVQLHHLHKMKDEFLATVSHELRTPLNAILGWSQILKEEGPNTPDFAGAMATIERNAKNQSHLIEDLLDVSRIISGKMVLHRDDIEATSLLKQSIETVFPMTEARRQKLHLQIPSTPILLKGDATRVTQIFWNLLSNASKFTPEGGDISVVMENAGHYFRLEISDSGKGISPEFLPHLFDRFSQADGSFTRRHGGLGLGLAIVRHLAELHGGTVTAQSEGEGKGSTFTVFLPQNTTDKELDQAQTLTHFSQSESKTLKLKGLQVLVVDDEADSLRLTRFVLEKYGASIKMADSAEAGFEILTDWQPDILICDLSMPQESGYELIRRIRLLSSAKGGEIPAIALTALAGREQREAALSAGFQIHIAKPFEPLLLAEGVLSLVAHRKTDKRALTSTKI